MLPNEQFTEKSCTRDGFWTSFFGFISMINTSLRKSEITPANEKIRAKVQTTRKWIKCNVNTSYLWTVNWHHDKWFSSQSTKRVAFKWMKNHKWFYVHFMFCHQNTLFISNTNIYWLHKNNYDSQINTICKREEKSWIKMCDSEIYVE